MLPPLQNGDRLTRPEFERRYDAMLHLKKAELIDGRVYMASPVSHRGHGRPHVMVVTWLGQYLAATPGVDAGDNGSIRLDLDNMPQPDAFLMLLPEHGGQARVDDDDYIQGAPELVAEVAASSVSYDLHEKRDLYRRSGVREYLIWRVRDREIDWFVLRGSGEYERLKADPEGVLRSGVFPGLWLDTRAMLAGDLERVTEVLRAGLSTPEHAAFIRQPRTGGEGQN